MHAQSLSFVCVWLSTLWLHRVSASCYYPDGKFPEDYIYKECSDTGGSSCCKLEDGNQCLSNGLCYDATWGQFYRGGCSDQSWKSGSCFQHCKGSSSDPYSSFSSYDSLVSCGDNKYCCDSEGSTCCNDDTKVFEVASASVIKDLSISTTYSGPSFAATATETASNSIGTQATPSRHKSTESSSTAKSTQPPVGTAASASAASSSTDTGTGEPSHKISKIAIISGVAAGVFILLVIVIFVIFAMRRRYRKKLAAGSNSQSFPMSSDGFQKLPDNQAQQQMPDKSPRPVEVYAPMHSPAPPAYVPPPNGAVEIDNSYRVPPTNQWGRPVFEAPAQPYHR